MIDLTSHHSLLLSEQPAVQRSARRTTFFAQEKQLIVLHWLIILTVGVFATNVVWTPGLLWGHSAWYDLLRCVEFDAAVRGGEFFPTWSPDFYHGHGSPLFQFYAPLAYFVVEVPLLARIDIVTALKLAQISMLIASGVAMYRLASANVSRWAAVLGAVFYMIAPYRMLDLFIRHSLAEHFAFVWFPVLVLGTQRFVSQGRRCSAVAVTIATAGLILTHNVMALIGLPICIAVGWFLSAASKNWRSVAVAAAPALIGIGIAAFFWWPALSARHLVRADESLSGGYFDFHRHFVEASHFFGSRWMTAENADGLGEILLQIGWPHLVAAIGAVALLRGKGRSRWSIGGAGLTAIALVMCHALSRPIWELLPPLRYVQFPWRFLAFVVFGTTMCAAAVIDRLGRLKPRLEMPVVLGAIGLVLWTYFPSYSTAQFLAADEATRTMIRVTAEQADRIAATRRFIALDSLVTPAAIRSADERATSSDDFLPRGVREKPTATRSEPISTDAGKILAFEQPALNTYRAEISLHDSATVKLHQFWFPGWTASLDGQPLAVRPFGASAIVSCDAPAGVHTIEFKYTHLPHRRVGSIMSWVSVVAALLFYRPQARRGSEAPATP